MALSRLSKRFSAGSRQSKFLKNILRRGGQACLIRRGGGKASNAAQRLETSLLRTAESVTSFGDSLHGSEGAKQVGMAVNDLSMKIKERTEQFLKMTTTFEQSRTAWTV